jgi:hypothetical protein
MTNPEETRFHTRFTRPDVVRIGGLALAVLAFVVSAALTAAASPSASPGGSPAASSAPGASTSPSVPGNGRGFRVGPGLLPFGFGGPGDKGGAGFGGPAFRGIGFGQVTIVAIDGSSLSLKTDDGWTRTISVASSTKLTKGGATIALGDLKIGDQIRFAETRNSDGSFTITAVEVVVPHVAGTVSATSASGFTVTARDGTVWTVTVNASTTYTKGMKLGGGGSASKADVAVGDEVDVAGTQGTNNTITALSVRIALPTILGQVTAKNGSSLTVKKPDGTRLTVHVNSSTTYRVPGVDNPGLGDITVGSQVIVQGSQRADGSIDAVDVLSGSFRGSFRGPFGKQPSASPSPSGTTG